MLTQTRVEKAPPGRYSDGKGSGLILEVTATGRRRWSQRIRVGGRVHEFGLGTYPEVGLAKARELAQATRAKALEAAQAGIDPVAARKAPAQGKRTVADTLTAWLAAHGPAWRGKRTARLARSSIERHAARLLTRPVEAVTLSEVRDVLAPVWSTAPVMAVRLRGFIEAIFDYAAAAGWRTAPNPAAWRGGLKPLLAKPSLVHQPRHHSALPWQTMARFMAALRDQPGMSARALELIALTACRSGEARGARWEEFDFVAAIWSVPAVRTKTGKAHRVPLPADVVAMLRSLPTMSVGGRVFPARTGDGVVTDTGLLKLFRRMDRADRAAGGPGYRDEGGRAASVHGLRATFRNWCGDTGQPRELAEAALSHSVGNATERAYARTDLLERRRTLMAAWADACAGHARLRVVALA
jgi:integrase